MRMQLGKIGFWMLAWSSLALMGGCDDLTAGRAAEPAGAVRLTRVLVQDARFIGGPPAQRGAVIDLLDDAAPTACSDVNPCINQFLLAQTTPPLACSDPKGGVCVDPLKLPATGVPLNAGATNIRLVFNKLLDPSIETVTVGASGAPTGPSPYALKPGLVELLGPDGKPVADTSASWINDGSPDFTSDPIFIPFGPAIVVTPGSLAPRSNYIIRLHPSLLHGRDGAPVADKSGVTLADPTDLAFTTEDVTANAGATYPDFTMTPATIAPNEVVQLGYWSALDEATVMPTISGPVGFVAANLEAYADRGASPVKADCDAALNPSLIDFVYTTGGAARMASDWPAGDYTLTFTARDATGQRTYSSPPLHFTVAGADGDPTTDANASAQHVIPEACK